jgi:hypothetical protein
MARTSISRPDGLPREVAVPVSVFAALRDELDEEVGTLETVRAMQHAGYTAGLEAALSLNRESGGDAFVLTAPVFWAHLSEYFQKRGWGSLAHFDIHAGIGVLSSPDWAEALPGTRRSNAGCGVSAGFLSGLLSQLAGGAVAVLEARCRSRGDGKCDFAFGSETAIHELYGHMLEGADLEQALQAL